MSKNVMNKRPFRVNFENLSDMKSEDLVGSEVLVKVLKVEVPKAINKAILEKKLYAAVFEINTSGIYVEIHKKDWINAINSCIDLYTKEEEYEKCGELTKTLQLLTKTK
jgi:hypothetical protein